MSNYSPGDVERARESGKTLKIFPGNVFEKHKKTQEHKVTREKEVMKLLKEKWTDRTQPPPLHLFTRDNKYSKSAIHVAQTVWKQYKADRDSGTGKTTRINPDTYGTDPDQVYVVPQDKGAQFTYDGDKISYDSQGKYYSLRDPKNPNVLLKPKEFLNANEQLLNPVKHAGQKGINEALNKDQSNPQVKENGDLSIQSKVKVNPGNKLAQANYPSDTPELFPSKTVDDVSQFKEAATTSWSRGQGSLKTRNEQTIAYWDSKYEGISKSRDKGDLARALRTGEAWETGKGTIIYQPDRGAMQVFKARPTENKPPGETLIASNNNKNNA